MVVMGGREVVMGGREVVMGGREVVRVLITEFWCIDRWILES